VSYNANKILALINSARARSAPHAKWIEEQGDDSLCDQRFNAVSCSLKQGHFRDDRIEAKKTKVDEQGIKFKRPNVVQQTKQQTRMPGLTGLIPHSKIALKAFMDDMFAEIRCRQAKLQHCRPIPNQVKKRKEFLQLLKSIRLIEEDNLPVEQARGNKAFKKQSDVTFRLD